MELIVAVYDDWGIGKNGTQPIALSADRKFFRETTKGAMVIVGRKTLADFPGGNPRPNRTNVVLTKQDITLPNVITCHSPAEAAELSKTVPKAMVIGGGSIYRQMITYCDTAYITKVHACPESDTFFPNLDHDPDWQQTEVLLSGEENGIAYEMCLYKKIPKK